MSLFKKGTLTVIKTCDGFIFGGFTEEKWSFINNYVTDRNAFIFSLINRQNEPILLRTKHPDESIYCHPNHGPTFGKGHDIFISDDSNMNNLSHAYIGHTYQHPKYIHNMEEAKKFLAGVEKFQTADIEVFQRV